MKMTKGSECERELIIQGWRIFRFLRDELKLDDEKIVWYLKAFNLDTDKEISIADEEDLLFQEDEDILNVVLGDSK